MIFTAISAGGLFFLPIMNRKKVVVTASQEDEMVELLDVVQIAALLRKTVPSVRSDVSRNPSALPPRCKLPGSRRLLWRVEDVDTWLAACVERASTAPASHPILASNQPKGRGRPRKTESAVRA